MRGTWDDFTSKYGFADGEQLGEEDFDARDYIVRKLNTLPEFADRRAVAYDRPGMHNSCLIIILPAVEGATDKELLQKWLDGEIDEVELPLGEDWCIDDIVSEAYESVLK